MGMTMFNDTFEELDDSRQVVQELVEEYQAATKLDYLTWCPGKKHSLYYMISINIIVICIFFLFRI